ncbi:hypothetical protein NL676_000473 [Syzygium grande]|nr:hypothetical protein NL676_000473 [Syzygium grande]
MRINCKERKKMGTYEDWEWLLRAVRVSCAKVLRRLKDSQSHFDDLFPGNHLERDLAVNPTPVKKCM